ncbi:hypothetical protein MINT15_35110 [Saccharomonospora viridis]|uniref:Uncharacterized protein n=1 Tax=Saccharomonospora viridis TaxID=1852 RepID=A0A837D664_9PSEU|nr:hypothetical protein MINT15_35110 [Saccharomonospora viridis]
MGSGRHGELVRGSGYSTRADRKKGFGRRAQLPTRSGGS